MKRVVVGVDGTPHSDQALAWAADEAVLRDARLVVVHAWRVPAVVRGVTLPPLPDRAPFAEAAAAVLREAVNSVDARRLPNGVESRLVEGDASAALVRAARDAEVLVVGSRRRGRLGELLLGSVSRQVAHDAPVPVVVVGPDKEHAAA